HSIVVLTSAHRGRFAPPALRPSPEHYQDRQIIFVPFLLKYICRRRGSLRVPRPPAPHRGDLLAEFEGFRQRNFIKRETRYEILAGIWMVATCLGTRRDKALNFCFGIFPFSSAVLISRMREGSVRSQSWFSLIPLEFGNAVVLQTNLSGSGIKHCFLIFSVTQSRSWYKIQMTVGMGLSFEE
ncbi:hypothetical protein B0H11DRAFT_781982, partial [Mycena galericulata]